MAAQQPNGPLAAFATAGITPLHGNLWDSPALGQTVATKVRFRKTLFGQFKRPVGPALYCFYRPWQVEYSFCRGTGFVLEADADAGIPDQRLITAAQNIELMDPDVERTRPNVVYVCQPITIRVAALNQFRPQPGAAPPTWVTPPPAWPQADVAVTTFQSLLPPPEEIAKDYLRRGRPRNPKMDYYEGDGRGGRGLGLAALWLPPGALGMPMPRAHVLDTSIINIPANQCPALLAVGMPRKVPGYCGLVSKPPNRAITFSANELNKREGYMLYLHNLVPTLNLHFHSIEGMRGAPVVCPPGQPGGGHFPFCAF